MKKNNLFKSPLRYPGGKTRMIKKLLPYIPQNFSEYREPFLGGGSMLFYTINNHPFCTKKATDNFKELYNFWNMSKAENSTLVSAVKALKRLTDQGLIKNGRELHSMSRKAINNDDTPELTKAVSFFILNRISFSGLTLSGGYSKASFEGRFKESHIQTLASMAGALKGVEFSHSSYEKLLFEPGENVWIFLDPPYDIKADNLYGKRGNQHKGFNHVNFAEDCKKSPHNWLVTYNDNEKIRELFSWANIHEVPVTYNMNSNNKKVVELAITNY